MSGKDQSNAVAVTVEGGNPIFRVRDVSASVNYYRQKLGFKRNWGGDDDGFASVSRGRFSLMLCEGDQGNPGSWVWVGVSDAGRLFEELRASGARLRHPPTNYAWAYEFQVEDLDGNVLRFGSDPKSGQAIGEWLDMYGRRWLQSSEGEWEREESPLQATMPSARAEMLIRRPVTEVFEAFVNPAITSSFWFTKGSGRLEEGKEIRWDWEMYGHSVQVNVKAIEKDRRILVEWGAREARTTVEWIFTARSDNTTFVSITNSGFAGSADEIQRQLLDSTEGFTLVLAGLKAFLEYHTVLHLVSDRFPDAHKQY